MNSFIYSTRLNIGDIENIETGVDDKVESEDTRRRMQDERKAPSFCLSNPSRRRQGEAGRGKKIETVEQETRPIRA